ncbi:NifB/NifX family molybdenum-iron cluster-binding protein [Chromatium okenii]|uniref:Nitrogen fixation protein NifX n=1 Tax=Chromatium okenii TaxID=61644 RepID=A0A2S7XT42_9GAMM|nr:NifB/NifX family molybdenum-iron cluster-binding protein [Chromatium okenii]MBV5310091.1 nitrogen fixation protein NifX [Chromatium okenii]PQJ96581.1 nitrogen fixation protein NifX [Chromatium okenii]
MTVARRLKFVNCDRNEKTRMTTMIKVAFATTDRKHIDQHFGTAECLAIYQIDAEQFNLLEVVQFGQLDQDGNENKLAVKIEALTGCVAVYCQAIGASAVNQLRPKGIQPIKVPAGTSLQQTIRALQLELRDGLSAWLARAIEHQQQPDRDKRFDAMEEEGWCE